MTLPHPFLCGTTSITTTFLLLLLPARPRAVKNHQNQSVLAGSILHLQRTAPLRFAAGTTFHSVRPALAAELRPALAAARTDANLQGRLRALTDAAMVQRPYAFVSEWACARAVPGGWTAQVIVRHLHVSSGGPGPPFVQLWLARLHALI